MQDLRIKWQCGILKGITISEIGKQVKSLRFEPVEMIVQQVNCVASSVFNTRLETSLPVQTPRLYVKTNQSLFMLKSRDKISARIQTFPFHQCSRLVKSYRIMM